MNKERVYQVTALIGLALILISVLFLQTRTVVVVKKFDTVHLPSETYISIPVYLKTNDNITFTTNASNGLFIILSSSEILSEENSYVENITKYTNKNYTFRGEPGKYYLLIINNNDRDICFKYNLLIYKEKITEKYNGAVSITGTIVLFLSIILLLNHKMREWSKKYPDRYIEHGLECWSHKINKHRCKILLTEINYELPNQLWDIMKKLGYTRKRELSEELVSYERKPSFLKKYKGKPCEVIVSVEEPYLTLYYEVWAPVSSGTRDLAWIFQEAKKIRDYVYKKHGIGNISLDKNN